MLLKTPPRRRLTISLTPLIDVVFILLVFFMLVSQFAEWKQYELPTITTDSTSLATSSEQEVIEANIQLANDGTLQLNGSVVSEAELLQQLSELENPLENQAEQNTARLSINVNSQPEVSMQRNIDLLDALQRAGYERFNFSPEGE